MDEKKTHGTSNYGSLADPALDELISKALVTVPGIGHDGCAMGKAAAAYWFEGRIPSPEELSPSVTGIA